VGREQPPDSLRYFSQTMEEMLADDKTKRGPQDRSRINVHEVYEVRYWTHELGVSKEQLEQAVQAAGSNVEPVRAHLKGAPLRVAGSSD
jgi:hypothetical protein